MLHQLGQACRKGRESTSGDPPHKRISRYKLSKREVFSRYKWLREV